MKFLIEYLWYIIGALAVIFLGVFFLLGIEREDTPQEQIEDALEEINNEEIMDTKAQGEAFLEANKDKEGVVVTESGLQYVLNESVAEGDSPTLTSNVLVHYHGTTIDGEVFDSSVVRGEPIAFPLGGVIEGWQEGLQLMKVGEKFTFYIPNELAYGDFSPSAAIPAGSALIFEVELLGIE